MVYVRKRRYGRKVALRRKGVKYFAGKRKYRKSGKTGYIKKIVKQVLDKRMETKTAVSTGTDAPSILQLTCPTIAGNYRVVSPSQSTYGWTISKGTDDNQRIGNRINVKRLQHSFVVDIRPYNASTNNQVTPCYVRMYWFRSKWNPVSDVALGNLCGGNANFFDQGSSDTGFQGQMMDMNRKIQNENYTYLTHRTYKLGPSTPAITSGTTTQHIYTNNDFKLCVTGKVELGKHIKQVVYNDSNQVMTPWIFFVTQVVAADNTLLSTAILPINVVSQFMLDYTDA